MRRVFAAVAVACTLALAGCGHGAAKKAASAESNAQVQQDSKTAQQIAQACMTKGSLVTHAGRTAIIDCIAPPGHAPQFEACAQQQLSKAHLTTKTGRENYLQAVVTCGEKNR